MLSFFVKFDSVSTQTWLIEDEFFLVHLVVFSFVLFCFLGEDILENVSWRRFLCLFFMHVIVHMGSLLCWGCIAVVLSGVFLSIVCVGFCDDTLLLPFWLCRFCCAGKRVRVAPAVRAVH